MNNIQGKLYLIPSPIGDSINDFFYSSYYLNTLLPLRNFIVEETRTTRRFLRKLIPNFPINDCTFVEYNEHHLSSNPESYLIPLQKGYPVGLISEAGCPTIADPGYPIILAAHKYNIEVIPLIGPSSLILSLMASGLPAQNFKFNGYLPAKSDELVKCIQKIEKQSKNENLTQLFIETPYRNHSLFQTLLKTCNPDTLLCIAVNLTQPNAIIKTQTIQNWKKKTIVLEKVPAIFILYSGIL